jgi:hypothetical protein
MSEKREPRRTPSETLSMILASLKDVTDAPIGTVLSGGLPDASSEPWDQIAQFDCCFCRKKVEAGFFLISMQCCGAKAHAKCLMQAYTPPRSNPQNTCPECHEQFSNEQIQDCRPILDNIRPPTPGEGSAIEANFLPHVSPKASL